jgi:CRISPR-associated endoribonuclease Cas6
LVGAFHKWLGENELHDEISLYSLSWLYGGKMRRDKKGYDFRHGAEFFISSPLEDLHKKAISGLFKDEDIQWGMRVQEVRICTTPEFGERQRFIAQSPVFIKKRREEGKGQQFVFPGDEDANALMTATLQKKLDRAGMGYEASVAFDPEYQNPKTKKITFNKIDLIGTFCPVIVEGDPEAVRFAWVVGVGHSTGIGFGALR